MGSPMQQSRFSQPSCANMTDMALHVVSCGRNAFLLDAADLTEARLLFCNLMYEEAIRRGRPPIFPDEVCVRRVSEDEIGELVG